MKGLEHLCCYERLGLFSLEKSQEILSSYTNIWTEDRDRVFPAVPSDRIRQNWDKLKHRMFCLTIRKRFFTLRVIKHWNRMPRELVESPSLEILNICLDMVLCHWLQVALLE